MLAIVTPGATDNVKDLLYLKGIDIAITHADVFEHFRNVEKIPNIEKRVNFISEMYISELHVLVRPEINSFKDLEGKKVSFHTPGAGPSVTGPILFQRLGIKVEPVYVNNAIAYEKMKTGEIAALIHTVGKPNDLFTKNKNEHGFKFLAVPYDKFEDFYVPSVFTAEDYPGYVKPGEKVETLGVQAVLAVYNWPRESDRFRRVSRFIDYYFDRFKNFHAAPYHPKWKSINLAAKVPGWTRYWVAEEKLKQMAARGPEHARRRYRPAAGAPAGRARRAQRCGRAGAPVPAVPGVEQVAEQAVMARAPSRGGERARGAMIMPDEWQLAPATRGGIATAMRGKGLALAALAALAATVAFAAAGVAPAARAAHHGGPDHRRRSRLADRRADPDRPVRGHPRQQLHTPARPAAQRVAVGRLCHRTGLVGRAAARACRR